MIAPCDKRQHCSRYHLVICNIVKKVMYIELDSKLREIYEHNLFFPEVTCVNNSTLNLLLSFSKQVF
jgi:hypothetical protein